MKKPTEHQTQFLLENHPYDHDLLLHLGFTPESISFYNKKDILKRTGFFYEFDFVGFLYILDKEFFVCPKYRVTVYENSMVPIFKKLFTSFKTETISSQTLMVSKTLSRNVLLDFVRNGVFKEVTEIEDEDWSAVEWDDIISDSENFMGGHLIVSEPQTVANVYSSNSNTLRMQQSFISFVLDQNPELIDEVRIPSSFVKPQVHSKEEMIRFFRKELSNARLFREKRMLKFYVDLLTTEHSEHSYYGTKYFNNIWENVCKFVFDDVSPAFRDSFPKPVYTVNGKSKKIKGHIPDVISLPDKTNCFVLDAKYYNVEKNLPLTEDITKQLFYERLCKKLFPKRKFHNAFLFLNEQPENIINIGSVIYDVFDEKEITLYTLKDTYILSLFCEGKHLNPKMLLS